MRFYGIRITDPATGELLVPSQDANTGFTRVDASTDLYTFSSLANNSSNFGIAVKPWALRGSSNPAALAIVLDIASTFFHMPLANSYIRIWNPSLEQLSHASDLNFLNISVEGGMAAGLPFANPNQAGLLCSGQIKQAFGNWIGTAQSLDFYMQFGGSSASSNQTTANPAMSQTTTTQSNQVAGSNNLGQATTIYSTGTETTPGTLPLPTTNASPAPIVFQWQPGQPLLNAIVLSLQVAFPQYVIVGAISQALQSRTGTAVTGIFATLKQFAEFLNAKTVSIVQGYAPNPYGGYQGVSITLHDNTITIADGTTQPATTTDISFIDLIGQPTWIGPYQCQATVVLRGDLQVGDYVTLPEGLQTVTSDSGTQYANLGPPKGGFAPNVRDKTTFSGRFQIQTMRHVGESRNPDGLAWCTVLNLFYVGPQDGPSTDGLGTVQTVDAYPLLSKSNNKYGFWLP